MKRQNYYPSQLAKQVLWLGNYAGKLPTHGPTTEIATARVTASVADAKWAAYVIGAWLTSVREFAPSTTSAVDAVLNGTGAGASVLPGFTAPTLPTGVVAVLPGVLKRIFAVVADMKDSTFYTESIGQDMGIIGAEDTMSNTTPKFLTALVQGTGGTQVVRMTFYKYGHMGVYIESKRGTGAWEFLTIDTESPYVDERPLLAAGVPEVREYRMRFWDKGTPNGDWTDTVTVTVSP